MEKIDKKQVIELLQDILNFCEQHKDSNEYDYVVAYEPDDFQFISTGAYLKDYIHEKMTKLSDGKEGL